MDDGATASMNMDDLTALAAQALVGAATDYCRGRLQVRVGAGATCVRGSGSIWALALSLSLGCLLPLGAYCELTCMR